MAAAAAADKVWDVVLMPGDGIGNQVLPESIRALNAVGFKAKYHDAKIGWQEWCDHGNALPEETIQMLEKYKLGLFGAITSKPKGEANAELNPALKGKGFEYYSPIVTMRQRFNLDICLRPCIGFEGNPLNFIRRKGDGFEEPRVNVVVFRQNTECLYSGVEWTNPPDQVYAALCSHPRFKTFKDVPRAELAVSCRIMSRNACKRICEAAFDYAAKYGYKSVTVCEKPNVIRETSGMMEEEAKKAQKKYPQIKLYSTNIDAQMMWMTKNPEDYDVIISGNMFGDIASDGFAGLVGGLGFAASGNIGADVAVFEPTHGSAPKYAELQPPIVNPIAMILAAVMMLEHIGELDKAKKIRQAIAEVIKECKVQTYDMKKLRGGKDVLAQGAASTIEITDEIIRHIRA